MGYLSFSIAFDPKFNDSIGDNWVPGGVGVGVGIGIGAGDTDTWTRGGVGPKHNDWGIGVVDGDIGSAGGAPRVLFVITDGNIEGSDSNSDNDGVVDGECKSMSATLFFHGRSLSNCGARVMVEGVIYEAMMQWTARELKVLICWCLQRKFGVVLSVMHRSITNTNV